MRLIFGLVLIFGVGLAGFAVYLAQDYVGQYEAELAAERAARAQMVPTVEVLVATGSMRYGQRLREEDVRSVRWPENAIPEGSFASLDELFPDGGPAERTVARAMEKDEAILATKVTEPGEDAGVSARLASGMRAFALRVDVSSGVSGFLRPGDRVDIYWTGSSQATGEGAITRLIDSGVRLLAIDQTADSDTTNPVVARTVTVEASPRQVAAFAQAQSTGQLSLALVGAGDVASSEPVQLNQRELLGVEEEEEAAAPQREVCTVRTRRGSEVVEVPVACTN